MGVCRERRPLWCFCGAACARYLWSLSVTVIVQLYKYVLAAEAGNQIMFCKVKLDICNTNDHLKVFLHGFQGFLRLKIGLWQMAESGSATGFLLVKGQCSSTALPSVVQGSVSHLGTFTF